MMRGARLSLTLVLAATLSACAVSLRNPHIADLRDNPGRYQDRTVSIDGTSRRPGAFRSSPSASTRWTTARAS